MNFIDEEEKEWLEGRSEGLNHSIAPALPLTEDEEIRVEFSFRRDLRSFMGLFRNA